MTGSGTAETVLMQALGFTLEDLNCNRAGEMSERQLYQFRVRRRRSIAIGVLMTLVMVFIASLLIFSGNQEDGSFILTVVGIGVTICNAALVGVLARHWLRLSADLRAGSVQAVSDTLERVIKPVNRRVFNYAIRVGKAEAFVSKETFEAFAHNTPYTIYRAPHTGTLFSAERLGM